MPGEKDLDRLLQNMHPKLAEQTYVFCSMSESDVARLGAAPLMVFREAEGVTVVLTEEEARSRQISVAERWALITCEVHSDLNAVGFLARITAALAQAGIPANAVSAYFHDHIFVPASQFQPAMAALAALTGGDAD